MYNLQRKIKYKFNSLLTDNRIALMFFITFATILFILIISIPMVVQKTNEQNNINIIWDNFATAINAWWPFTGDGVNLTGDSKEHVIYIISKVIIAIFGLLLTSTLIGYISERISAKFFELQKGQTEVIEKGHIIVVGYDYNNLTLIKELIKSNTKRKVLIVDDKDIFEVKEHLRSNIETSNGIKIIYRSLNSTNIEDLKKCGVENSYAVVIQPMDDIKTLKTIMAVKQAFKNSTMNNTHIVAAVKDDDLVLKFTNNNDIMFSTNSFLARIIAVSSAEVGLSKVLTSIFSFSDSEIYIKEASKYTDLTFGEVMYKMYNGTPIGIYRDNKNILIPNENEKMQYNDALIYYADEISTKVFLENIDSEYNDIKNNSVQHIAEQIEKTILILGYNHKFEMVINQFDRKVKKIIVANVSEDEIEKINYSIKNRNLDIEFHNEEINMDTLSKITSLVDHIIILSRESLDDDQSDIENMILYLRLIKLRERKNLKWTLTTELNFDSNRELIEEGMSDDFIVSSNIVSIMLAQLVEDYRVRSIFIELLSNNGIRVSIDDADRYVNSEERIAELRIKLLRNGNILLGYIVNQKEGKKYIYNPNRNERVKFNIGDKLILLKR